MNVGLVIEKRLQELGFEPGFGGGGRLEKQTVSPETNGPKKSVPRNTTIRASLLPVASFLMQDKPVRLLGHLRGAYPYHGSRRHS